MPVNLSIKNVPDEWAQRLRERAERNHRSLQGELMALLEQATGTDGTLAELDEAWREYRTEAALPVKAKERTMRTQQVTNDRGRGDKVALRWPSAVARMVRETRDIDGAFEDTPDGLQRMRALDASEIRARMRKLGIRTPGNATDIVRRMRDERHR